MEAASQRMAAPFRMRISLRSREIRPPQPESPELTVPKSSKIKSKRYRERVKNDPEKYAQYLAEARLRSQSYRDNMTEEKRKAMNEQSKMRMRKMREKKKRQAAEHKESPGNTKEKKVYTRSEELRQKETRDRWKEEKRRYRAGMTAQKRRRINEKRRAKYRESKAGEEMAEVLVSSNLQQTDLRSDTAKRKALQRVRQSLPKSPLPFATTVGKLIDSCSPAKKNALAEAGIGKSSEVSEKIIVALRNKFAQLKSARNQHERGFNKNLLASFKVMKKYRLLRRTSTTLGISWKRMMRHRTSKIKNHKLSLPKETIDKVQSFYVNNAVPLPYKKAFCKKSGKPKLFVSTSIATLYKQFKIQHPSTIIGRTMFHRLRPQHVKLMSQQTLDQCLCEYCTNTNLKIQAINRLVDSNKIKDCRIKDLYKAIELIVCHKEEGNKFYKTECIDRSCTKCSDDGIKAMLGDLIVQLSSNNEVSWKEWVTSKGTLKQSRKVLSTKTGTVDTLIDNLTKEVVFLTRHLHTASWQHNQFQKLKNNLPDGWVVMVLDFGENYTCNMQDEVQAAHWNHEQCTIHPIVAYYRCPQNGCGQVTTESMVFLTADRKHDHHAVNFFVDVANSHLQTNRKLNIVKEVHFTDGCAAQYKSKWAFYAISKSISKFGFDIERAYFGSRHGKGPSDGETAVIKSGAAAAVKARMVDITDANDLFKFCSENLTRSPSLVDGSCDSHFLRTFFWVPDEAIKRDTGPAEVTTVAGTRLIHSVKAVDDGFIKTRNLSCFCSSCVENNGQACESRQYVHAWVDKKLTEKFADTDLVEYEDPLIPDDDPMLPALQTSFDGAHTPVRDDHDVPSSPNVEDKDSHSLNSSGLSDFLNQLEGEPLLDVGILDGGVTVDAETDVDGTSSLEAKTMLVNDTSISIGNYIKVRFGSNIYPAVVVETPLECVYGCYFERAASHWKLDERPFTITKDEILGSLPPPNIITKGTRISYIFSI